MARCQQRDSVHQSPATKSELFPSSSRSKSIPPNPPNPQRSLAATLTPSHSSPNSPSAAETKPSTKSSNPSSQSGRGGDVWKGVYTVYTGEAEGGGGVGEVEHAAVVRRRNGSSDLERAWIDGSRTGIRLMTKKENSCDSIRDEEREFLVLFSADDGNQGLIKF
ncbi:hypothetical protein SASPL_153273 [Salvia splendens]|uniref:Uncharacterized protein n=1 Tax=Salvia splendens TaxID=180675 RepID=A0A8X8Z153_SALSN|nr:hypothetical protein SASPL_153273 [Salvia splendens]